MKPLKMAGTIPLSLLICSISTLSACSTQSWYEGTRSAHDVSCMKLPDTEYKDCMNETQKKSWKQYQQDRENLEKR